MGGGLFGTPLYLNVKCLVFSAFVLLVYWLPHPEARLHNIVMGFLLATASYISLAWYDVLYDCNDRLGPTIFGWLSMPLKPKYYGEQFNELPIKYKKIIRTVDIFVLIIVGIAIVYPFVFSGSSARPTLSKRTL